MKIEKKHYDSLFEIDSEISKLDERIQKDEIRLRKLRQDRQIVYDTLRDNRRA